MKKIIIFCLSLAVIIVSSCTETTEGFLDSKGKEKPDTEAIFADSSYTVMFHTALYMQLGRIASAPHSAASMIQDYKDYEQATDNSRSVYFYKGDFAPAYTKADFTQSGVNAGFSLFKTSWEEMYQSIQRCNTFINNYSTSPISDERKSSMLAEARFLRAFYYFHLLRSYGSVPLLYDKVLDPFENELIPRATFEELVNYLIDELKSAATALPLEQEAIDFGRPTKGSALALIGKIYWLAASPLHNGGNIGSGDNRLLVGYDDYQVERWQKTADALKEMMNLNSHELVVDNETRPGNGYYLATTKRVSKERIWYWLTTNAFTWPQQRLLPPSRGGTYRSLPYHELTEAYPMIDGRSIKESGLYDNNSPYENRDPRFGFTIIYHGAKWIKSLNGVPEPVYTHLETPDEPNQDGIYKGTTTGYYFRKGCKEEYLGGTTNSEANGVSFIRYADVMLMYAEALTELDVNANRATIEKQLFELRERAGIEAGDDGRYGIQFNMNKEQMIDFILNERRIEFASEAGNRFWDLKRRKTYEKLDKQWTNAAVWTKSSDGSYTWYKQASEQHFFNTRMYFSAIPLSEVNASRGTLIQNPGW